MHIYGFAKTTLLDYPKHVASTIFTGGCNFRCPFCHNGDLVLSPNSIPEFSEDSILSFLDKRKNILDGVCITGGEPTLQADLSDFIQKVRSLGLLVKLDTNGYSPEVLKDLIKNNQLDYVAMDIKNSPEKYAMTCGLPSIDFSKIEKSAQLLLEGNLPFEFRTTVTSSLHELSDFESIGKWINGAPAYYLQSYKESEHVISPGFSPCSIEELNQMKNILLNYVPVVELRGVDG